MKIERNNGLSMVIPLSSEEKLEQPGTYMELIKDAIDTAISSGASDIHFEPTTLGYKIRLRINGLLDTFFDFSKSKSRSIKPDIVKSGVTSALKALTDIELGNPNKEQEGKIGFPKRAIDIRVAKMPLDSGEKFVFRLFNRNEENKLENIGLSKESYQDLVEASQKKAGLIVITGETGSGKTSTIYSLIDRIDKEKLNVATLENPAERSIEGVNHTSVNPQFGFADGLRALLRQDPDVIIVGEIRDQVTAQLALRAATTGHLVISTMHTNTALNVPKVFEHYGADKMQLMSALLIGANQRLIRRICQSCAKPGKLFKNSKIVNPKGCKRCNSGFSGGRMMFFEYFTANEIKEDQSIVLKTSIEDLVKEQVMKGVIDENEIYRQSAKFSSAS